MFRCLSVRVSVCDLFISRGRHREGEHTHDHSACKHGVVVVALSSQ